MKKNIWIINEYAGSPYHGMEFRHYYLGKELTKLNYNVTIITASFSHLFRNPPKVDNKFRSENIDGINYLWIKVPKYSNSTDKRRVLKWINFTYSLIKLPLNELSRPDYIILSPMETLPVIPTIKLVKNFSSKFIFEVKDIWPLSIVELGNYSPKHPFIRLLKYCETLAIKKADLVVSVLPNYGEYLKENGFNRNFIYLPNGIDLEEMSRIEPLSEDIRNKIPQNKFIVAYTGTIGIANALEYLIKAGKILRNYKDILILIVGKGGEKGKLEKLAQGYSNIKFLPAIPKNQIQSLLSLVDVCYIGLRKKNLFKYGVSPNKIFDYMYAAKPIIHAINTKNDIVTMANCGLSVEAENPEAIADAILKLYKMNPEERKRLGENGRKYVIENHSYTKLARKYANLLENL
ncbi:Glycosyltransferase involved in cell wall bisynthesis [Balnearium lithotrophicum]|uniref:Glycosyltransferase involved in cell wall bisynthesis n=1 Tax=Balnearium lithotrophicum TaxID=223788 RepID=A0A521C7H1_9BACT|nr:glycosyltransferase family 4 protein [Balnearium lithotrophicum]SMO55333.1 Glycosyltransferase involved in cell wall bisynthesis [Balnearium lithotrophicum]